MQAITRSCDLFCVRVSLQAVSVALLALACGGFQLLEPYLFPSNYPPRPARPQATMNQPRVRNEAVTWKFGQRYALGAISKTEAKQSTSRKRCSRGAS